MSHLMIENAGVAPLESFLMLGLSDARGDSAKIGQFGSGAKHGILTCLRSGLEVTIYRGTNKIDFVTVLKNSEIGSYQQVCYRLDNQTLRETNMTLGFGELDWQDTSMAIREFISNAIDQSNSWGGIKIEVKDDKRAKSGTTRVFIECNSDVKKYLGEINWRFLHPRGLQDTKIITKIPDNCRFYRKGVFVREIDEKSIFDYNASNEMSIDESRNADSYKVRGIASALLTADVQKTKDALVLMAKSDKYYESSFSEWYMDSTNVATAIIELYGENAYVTSLPAVYAKTGESHTVILLPNGWAGSAIHGGIQSAESLLTKAESMEGIIPTTTKPNTIAVCQQVWESMLLANMTNKDMPTIRQFSSNMQLKSQTYGFYETKSKEIWLHDEHATNMKTILEEMCHYASGANDETRDFQDFVLRFASRLIS